MLRSFIVETAQAISSASHGGCACCSDKSTIRPVDCVLCVYLTAAVPVGGLTTPPSRPLALPHISPTTTIDLHVPPPCPVPQVLVILGGLGVTNSMVSSPALQGFCLKELFLVGLDGALPLDGGAL